MSRREDVVKALEDIDIWIGSLGDLDGYLKEIARARLRRVVDIINMQDKEVFFEWQEADLPAPSEDEEAELQDQLTLVLGKVEELEEERGICSGDALWDSMYVEHGIVRKRMARLVGRLTEDGLIRSVRPGFYRRVK